MNVVTIQKAENGFIITDDCKTWIASSNYDVADVVKKAFNSKEEDDI